MTLILDAGALIAVERGDRAVVAMLKAERRAGRVPATHGGIVGQVWRGGARQALLARLLDAVEVVPLDDARGRRAGALLGRSGSHDVVDAALALLAADGDLILTSDTGDLVSLVEATGTHVELIAV
jgi:predicted nucleic acid-binding protein